MRQLIRASISKGTRPVNRVDQAACFFANDAKTHGAGEGQTPQPEELASAMLLAASCEMTTELAQLDNQPATSQILRLLPKPSHRIMVRGPPNRS